MSEQALPIIAVSDIAAVRCFYEQLGFLQTCQFPSEGEPGFVWTKRGAASVGIGAQGANELDRFSMWVDVDDVDPALDVLRAAGAPVVAEPEDQPWGDRVAQTRTGTWRNLGAALRPIATRLGLRPRSLTCPGR